MRKREKEKNNNKYPISKGLWEVQMSEGRKLIKEGRREGGRKRRKEGRKEGRDEGMERDGRR